MSALRVSTLILDALCFSFLFEAVNYNTIGLSEKETMIVNIKTKAIFARL